MYGMEEKKLQQNTVICEIIAQKLCESLNEDLCP